MTRLARAVIFVSAAMCAVPASAASRRATARDPAADGWLSRSQLAPAVNKLGRGAGNALTGWLEVPLAIRQRYASQDPVSTFVTGTVIGTVNGVRRTLVGTYEVVTFFLPYPNDFGPLLPPLEYFGQAPPRSR